MTKFNLQNDWIDKMLSEWPDYMVQSYHNGEAIEMAASRENDNDIYISGVIDAIDIYSWSGRIIPSTTARRIRGALKSIGRFNSVNVFINSPGGSLSEGLEIYNLLKDHRGRVNVIITGIAASAAQLVAMGGDHIYMREGTFQMIHSPFVGAFGNYMELEKVADDLRKFHQSAAKIISNRASNLTYEQVNEMMEAETFMSAEDCCDAYGLAEWLEDEKNNMNMYYGNTYNNHQLMLDSLNLANLNVISVRMNLCQR